ncbi:MAG: tetratricopeptide repeat protein [Sulfuricurvum sp.]|jgi:tetratricopeptide (TPR) repeat protein|uniref:tetratricopeptide repeat protein n=1 Tax=Sulfuricurvum sp. TaxID=2025608 RepID=UPI0025CE41BD|nr:tetratricopeptide repeat protein [Sulfuricurvum sp.]MCI4405917.1 tetratricopeptide repeat protein [Sulfuricurvum sp.]
MSTFQILMFAATLFFAFQIYHHVQNLEDKRPNNDTDGHGDRAVFSTESLVEEADGAYERGEIGRAKEILEEAYRLEPTNPEIVNKLAYVTAKSGDRLRGIELYERSLELDENDDLTHNAIASLYRSERAYERAQDHYLKALEIDERYPQTYFNYGNLLVDMGEREQAREMYKRALELQSDFPQAREALLSLGDKA